MYLRDDILERVAGLYGLRILRVESCVKGYRNASHIVETDQGMRNIILYKAEPHIISRIRSCNSLGQHLTSQGIPVRHAIDSRIMRLHANDKERFVGLYNYLPGETIPWEAYTMKHIKLLGMVMSDMHAVMQGYIGVLPSFYREYSMILQRMRRYFARRDVERAVYSKLHLALLYHLFDDNERLFNELALQPSQALHMDFVRGNILFQTMATPSRYTIGLVSLSGVLDFEKACHGPAVCDIARTLAFLYVDCASKDRAKIDKYFLVSGYEKRGKAQSIMNAATLLLIDRLVTFFLAYDLYKFLRDNPYESLPLNHHFVRTRDMLIARKVLQYNE